MAPVKIAAFGFLILSFSANVWAACDPEEAGSVALSAYSLKGHGNFACSDLGMTPTPGFFSVENGQGTAVTQWGTNDVDADGKPLQTDAIIIEPSSGKRCLFNFAEFVVGEEGVSLSSPESGSIRSVEGCWDGSTNEPPPEPRRPLSTLVDSCQGLIFVSKVEGACPAGSSDEGNPVNPDKPCLVDYLSVTAVKNDDLGLPSVAVCTGTATDVQGNQVQCLDECLPNPGFVDEDTCHAAADAAMLPDGRLPVNECSRCAVSGKPVGDPARTCWEYVDDYDPSTVPASFSPAQSIGRQGDTEIYDGSTCYKTRVKIDGIVYTYTTCL